MLDELADRYGDPPAPVLTLIAVSRLRRQAQSIGLSDVVVMGNGDGATDAVNFLIAA